MKMKISKKYIMTAFYLVLSMSAVVIKSHTQLGYSATYMPPVQPLRPAGVHTGLAYSQAYEQLGQDEIAVNRAYNALLIKLVDDPSATRKELYALAQELNEKVVVYIQDVKKLIPRAYAGPLFALTGNILAAIDPYTTSVIAVERVMDERKQVLQNFYTQVVKLMYEAVRYLPNVS
jgi:hypothetical protein